MVKKATQTKKSSHRFNRFGVKSNHIIPRVQTAYKIIHKISGLLGGNGYNGPIYGEITMSSMQKVAENDILNF